jgi:hypothetical protein
MAMKMIGHGRLLAAVLCALGLIPLLGCGDGGPKRVSVSGTVTLDGKPINGGILSFSPDASKGNTARASCSAPIMEGRYELQTSGVLRSETGSGAPLGWYKVTVRTNLPGQPKIEVNNKYRDHDKTPLSIEVVDNPEPGHYDIKLEN